MSYLVLSRKYRPQALEDVAGQEHIVQTITNALKSGRLAQSFLFVGSRGVGKTSTARILAKILNCLNRKPDVVEPCNTCDSCKEITQGISLDVLEVDGASNRGIDEIRSLRENVKFKPNYGKYKIYIIDEVHMLTSEAFNALLKTLEEPPAHVKFIFATTEAHRILPTIISRCQRYDFRRIPTKTIVATLKSITEKEGLAIDDEAVYAIAKAAEGSLRDAESVLDQLASYADGRISVASTEQVLGFTKEDTYFALIDAMYEKNAEKALTLLQQSIAEGKDLRQFNKGFLELLRDVLVVKTTQKPDQLVDRMQGSLEAIQTYKDKFSVEDLLYMITVLQNLFNQIKYSTFPQIYTEVALVKLAHRENMVALSDILEKLEVYDDTEVTTSPVRSKQAMPSASVGAEQVRATTVAPAQTVQSAVPHRALPSEGAATQTIQKKMDAYLESTESREPAVSSVAAAPKQPTVTKKEGAMGESLSLSTIEEQWANILAAVKKERMSLGVFLSEAEPIDMEKDACVAGFPAEFTFHKETLEQSDNKAVIEQAMQAVLGVPIRISFVVTEKEGTEAVVAVPGGGQPAHAGIIDSALDIFQGKTLRREY